LLTAQVESICLYGDSSLKPTSVSVKIRIAENALIHLTQYKGHGIGDRMDAGNLAGQDEIRLTAPPCLSRCKLTDNRAGGSYERKKKI
jgi:hypothetical protein